MATQSPQMLNDWTRIDAYVRQWVDYAAAKVRSRVRPNLPPTLLTDGDGVLLDFVGRVLDHVRVEFPGSQMSRSDIDTWRVENALTQYHALDPAAGKKLLYSWLERESFWSDMALMPYASYIRETEADKIVVTSPWTSCDMWHAHRVRLLRESLGLRQVVVTDQKSYVFGDVFIEDKWANLESWLRVWPEGRGVFVLTPYSPPVPAAYRNRVWLMTEQTAGEVMEEVQKYLRSIAREHPMPR